MNPLTKTELETALNISESCLIDSVCRFTDESEHVYEISTWQTSNGLLSVTTNLETGYIVNWQWA